MSLKRRLFPLAVLIGAYVFMLSVGVAVLILLTACGGNSDPTTENESIMESAQQKKIVPEIKLNAVVLYGDSTQKPDANGVSVASIAQDFLISSNVYVPVVSEGVGGSTAMQLLHGTDFVHESWQKEMAKSTALLVVTNHGINDHGYPLSIYRKVLIDLVMTAKQHGRRFMFETPNPVTRTGPKYAAYPPYDIAAFNARVQTMRDVADALHVPICDQHRLLTNAGLEYENVDGIHSNAIQRLAKGANMAQCIRVVLGL